MGDWNGAAKGHGLAALHAVVMVIHAPNRPQTRTSRRCYFLLVSLGFFRDATSNKGSHDRSSTDVPAGTRPAGLLESRAAAPAAPWPGKRALCLLRWYFWQEMVSERGAPCVGLPQAPDLARGLQRGARSAMS